jgi:hypothetical protein
VGVWYFFLEKDVCLQLDDVQLSEKYFGEQQTTSSCSLIELEIRWVE